MSDGESYQNRGRSVQPPEHDESTLRYERPSPHANVELTQAMAEAQRQYQLSNAAATASGLDHVAAVTNEGLSPTPRAERGLGSVAVKSTRARALQRCGRAE